jgi:hypothetical protein
MGPINMTSALAGSRQQDLHEKAARRRLTAGLPASAARSARFARTAGPGMVQRFALKAAGWGRRPAVVSPAALVPQTYQPAAG